MAANNGHNWAERDQTYATSNDGAVVAGHNHPGNYHCSTCYDKGHFSSFVGNGFSLSRLQGFVEFNQLRFFLGPVFDLNRVLGQSLGAHGPTLRCANQVGVGELGTG